MEGAANWLGEMRAALAEEFVGPPQRLRWLRILASLAIAVAFALAIPRIDHWPRAQGLPTVLLITVVMSEVWADHRERVLRRAKGRQVAVFLATLIAFATGTIVFVVVSVTFGNEPGNSPIERLLVVPPIELPLWPVIGVLLVVVLWRYRSLKREEAMLRAQADAEQTPRAAPPI